MGVLALFRAEAEPEFGERHARLCELLARRAAAVIASSYDPLSGLLTRPAFEQRVRGVLSAAGSAQSRWSALYIDMNRMHVINDNYGMHVGDRVLARIGELIRRRLPPGALAARISGDRFAILPGRAEDAAGFAGVPQGAEEVGVGIGDGSLPVSISIGVASVDPRAHEFAHAFAAAETVCKGANDRGRNRVETYQVGSEHRAASPTSTCSATCALPSTATACVSAPRRSRHRTAPRSAAFRDPAAHGER
jgi:diguanylate cyclase (GGDEF)-like protein